MRIAFDHQIFAMQSYGGISRYFSRLAEQLLLMGEEARIVAPLYRNRYLSEFGRDTIFGVSLGWFPPKSYRLISLLNHVASIPVMRTWKPNVIHETYYTGRNISSGKCATVITVYDMIHELFPGYFPGRDKTAVQKRTAVQRADHVICISESTRNDLLAHFDIPEERVSVVHLGFDRFVANKTLANDRFERPYLLYVGSRDGYKNFVGLLEAVAQSPRLKRDFDIVAFGGGVFKSREISLLSELGFQPERVRQLGGGDTMLGQLYEGASAFVYPSLYEGFGLPPLEAMAHQCPVVSSNSSSMPEVIGDAGEFFDPASSDDMAAAIERVVYSPQRSGELIERGSRRLNNFTWEKCANSTLEIYRALGGKV